MDAKSNIFQSYEIIEFSLKKRKRSENNLKTIATGGFKTASRRSKVS